MALTEQKLKRVSASINMKNYIRAFLSSQCHGVFQWLWEPAIPSLLGIETIGRLLSSYRWTAREQGCIHLRFMVYAIIILSLSTCNVSSCEEEIYHNGCQTLEPAAARPVQSLCSILHKSGCLSSSTNRTANLHHKNQVEDSLNLLR